MISKKFIKSSLIYTLAGALPMASALILLPFYIAYLPTSVYGVLAVCLSFSILVQIIVTYSFDTSLYVYYHEFKNNSQKLSSLISSAFIVMLMIGVVVIVFFSVAGTYLFSLIFSNENLSFYPNGLIAIGIGIFQALFKVYGNLLQTREKPVPFFWSNVVSFSIIAITTVVGLKLFPGTLVGPLGGRLLAGFLSATWALVNVFRTYGISLQNPWKLTSFSFNAFTFVYQLQQWAINYVDRFIILFFLPLSAVGVYNFALTCVVPIELLLNGMNASISPKIVSLITGQTNKGATPETNRYFYGLVIVILLGVCVTIAGVPLVLEFFVKQSGYGASIEFIPYLAIIYIFKSIRLYFVLPYTVLKKMERITVINAFVSLGKLGLMILLIYQWQLYGVIISSYVAYGIEIILLRMNLKNNFSVRFNFFKLIGVPSAVFLLIICLESMLPASYLTITHFAYGCLSLILLAVAYRNEIRLINPLKILK